MNRIQGARVKSIVILASVAILALILIFIAISWFGISQGKEKMDVSHDLSKARLSLQTMLRGITENIINDGTPASAALGFKGMSGFEKNLEKLILQRHIPELHSNMQRIMDEWQDVKRRVGSLLEDDFVIEENLVLENDAIMIRYGATTVKIERILQSVEAASEKASKIANEFVNETNRILGLIVLMILLITLSIFYKLYRAIKHTQEESTVHVEEMERALFRAEDVLKMLSKPPTLVPYFVTSPIYRTTRTVGGGDSLRWLNFRSQYAGLYLHDVSGHDIQEILLNILATAIVDEHKINHTKKAVSAPSIFLTNMNEQLQVFCGETSHYITAIYALMDYDQREIKISLAGHPRPWLIGRKGSAKQIGEQGLLLGQFDIRLASGNRYKDTSLRLSNGELLLLYSDGLMEQLDAGSVPFEKKFLGSVLPRLKGLNPGEAHNLLKSEFEAHLGGKTSDDDVSFIFISARPADKYETLEMVPGQRMMEYAKERKVKIHNYSEEVLDRGQENKNAAPRPGLTVINETADAYASIIKKLEEADWSPIKISHVKTVLEEMVINAIMHGNLCSDQCAVKISHILDADLLEVSVADEGGGFEGSRLSQTIEDDDLLMESGRGLHIIAIGSNKVYFNESGNKCWVLFTK